MNIFKRKPKIIKGHSFCDYFNHYGKGYINCKNEVITNKENLKPNHRYYEIDGRYYQIDHSRWIKNILITLGCASLATTVYLPIHFLVITPQERYIEYSFKYWNKCESLDKLKAFVKDVVTPGSENYVPKADRIATFDMDGTLFGERSPVYIEWMMYQDFFDYHYLGDKDTEVTYEIPHTKETRTVTLQQTYDEIQKFREGIEDENLEMDEAYCGAKLFAGLSVPKYLIYVESYLQKEAECFNNLFYKDMFYKPMVEVVEYLQQNNFVVYVVSGTDRFMVRQIISHQLNIPPNHVIGMDVGLYQVGEETLRTDTLKYKNVKKVKPELIMQEIYNWPVLSFGNSSGDVDMHKLTLDNPNYKSMAFMNVADDQERERGYSPEKIKERIKDWGDYQLFSMKNDWKTIYGDNVTLKK